MEGGVAMHFCRCEETHMAPAGCNSSHFGTIAPVEAGSLSIGLPTRNLTKGGR